MEILEHNLLVPERRSSFIHSTSPAPSTLNSPKSTNKLKLDNNSSLSNIEHINSTKSGVSGGSIPEPNYQSVKQMIHEILDKQFISPFPLSLIPAQVSMISTGMKRPLMNKLIKLPRITNGFADPSSHRSREGSHSSEPESVEPDEHSLGIVLLQSLVNSICANKEIIWEESWLPMICNRPGFSHLREEGHHQPQHTSTARSIVESSARSLLDRKPTQIFSSQNHHSASSSIGGRLSNNQSNTISTMQSSPSSALERKSLHLRATSSSHGNENENPKKSDLTRSRRLFPASGSTMATTSTTALMRKSSSSASPIRRLSSAQRSEIQSQRKKFDLIWSKWQESLGNVVNSTGHGHGGGDHQSFSNLGLSHALEMSFGWKCEVDLEFHQLLDRQFQYYQQQLKSTELQIEQVRKKSFQERQQQSQEDGVDDGNDSEKEAEGDTKGSTRRRRRRSFSDDQKMLKKMDKKKKKINESTRAEDQYTHDFLTTRRAELKKLMQSIQNDLMMVKKRLGILGSDPSSELNLKTTTKFGDDPDHPRFLGGSSHHPSTGAVPNITGTSSQEEHQGYGKLNIELFVAWKSFG